MAKADIPPLNLRARNVGAQVAAHLERLIALGELNPEDRLPPERDLAADLRVSRASLREAMHELQAKKLIERRPGRGTVVLPPPQHAHDLYEQMSGAERRLRDIAELRETVEPQIARLAAARATDANLVELGSVLTHTVDGLTAGRSVQLDQEFHLLLAQASQNPLLVSLSSLTSAWTRPVRILSHSTEQARIVSYRGHRAILDAVAERDKEGAAASMIQHLRDVANLTRQNYGSHDIVREFTRLQTVGGQIPAGDGCRGHDEGISMTAAKQTYSFTPSDGVPPQVGPFSHATRWGDLLFVTGQMPTDPATGELVPGDVVAQAEQVRRNLIAVLSQFGLTLDDALMVRVYLTSFDDFEVFNTAYTSWFRGPLPSRTCVGVTALAVGAAVEIDLIAGIPAPAISESGDA
ncbi:MAG TPA: Rid family hydrolase [Streptosporangiaceae bacterium]|nr:Rid family hydrolase [Streptosporangiaceae bacterium]